MNTTPVPTPLPIPADEPFLPKWTLVKFTDNEYQRWNALTFRDFATDINGKFARLDTLSTNQVRGAQFRVPYVVLVNGQPTVPTALIPVRLRIAGMDARAVNGTDQATAASGVRADPMDFRLLPNSAGPIDALVDEKATTTATVKCAWVRTSGTDQDRLASFEFLVLEDRPYKAGDVVKYAFPNGAIRLLEWRADSVGFQHPVPTGLDNDPIYAPFALPASAAYDDRRVLNLLDDVQGNVTDLRADMGDVQTLVAALQTGKVEVWQPGPKFANRVYFLIGGIGTGLYQPKANIGNSGSVSLAYYHALWVAPGNAFTANQTAAITNANAPSAANKFATFNDLPSANGTPAAPFGFVGFAAPRQMLWLRGYPGQVNSGFEASNGTSVSRLSVINPNNWPGLFAAVQDAASYIRSPRLWCKRIEVYTSWDGPGYDQRFRLRVFNGADDAVLVDKIVAIDQSSRYYNYTGWDWYRVGGGDGNTPSWVEILPAYLDCYVVINYVSGGSFIQSGIDIY